MSHKKEGKVLPLDRSIFGAASIDPEHAVEQLMNDRTAITRLIDEHRMFKEAIEQSPVAYCVYDADDTLIALNEAYEKLHPHMGRMRDARARGETIAFSDVMRAQLSERMSGKELERVVAARVAAQRNADGAPIERDNGPHGFYKMIKYRLSGGAVAGLAFDITDEKKREADLTAATALAEEAQILAQEALEAECLRKREARLLSELGEWLQSCKTLDELFEVIGRFMAKMFPGSAGELFIYSNSRDVLDGACRWNRDEQQVNDHIQPDDCWALRRGRMYKHGAGAVDFVCGHADDLGDDHEQTPYVCLPIIAHGDTVGLLHIRFACEPGCTSGGARAVFDNNVHTFAIQCSEQISLAIANSKLRDELRDQSTRDPLTGLFNRRYFMETLRREMANAERYNKAVSLIAIDVDNFKMFNDTHGHDAGDVVLRAMGEVMSGMFDGSDVVSRFGGEEFSVLLPGADAETAKKRAEELRTAVEELTIRYGEKTLPKVTISAGYAVYPTGGSTPIDMLKSADKALYAAKDGGRNMVCCL